APARRRLTAQRGRHGDLRRRPVDGERPAQDARQPETHDGLNMATETPDLTGRVVIVTGASRGIGKGLAIGFAKLGASVACAARSTADTPGDIPGTINDTLRAIEEVGGSAIAIRCDIGNEDDIHHLVDATVAEFGR